MTNAQPRVIGLVAIASWLLIDSIRVAGPLLSALYETSIITVGLATIAAFGGGGVLAWIGAMLGRNFGHGVVMMFLLSVMALSRLALPFVSGGWLIGAGLYLTAFAIAGVVMTSRIAMGNGGSGYVVAGTSLGAAAAVGEQAVLRTWDAVWRDDALGWGAIALVALLAIFNGWRCHTLEPAPASRGWWALGLHWSLLALAFANVAWVNAQTELRMSYGAALAIIALCVSAGLAAQAHRVSRVTMIVIGVLGIIALGVFVQREGSFTAFALPVAVAATALGATYSMRTAVSTPIRRFLASVVFGLLIIVPPALVHIESDLPLGFPHLAVMLAVGIAVIAYGASQRWAADATGDLAPNDAPAADDVPADSPTPAAVAGSTQAETPAATPAAPTPWILPGVPLRVGIGVVAAIGLGFWTHSTYEQERNYSADFVAAPYVMSWNVHQGVTHEMGDGPRIDLDEIALTVAGNDVIALQEVNRGTLFGGGTDMLEFLAGELELPYSYSAAHDRQYGNAIFTSRPHSNPRDVELTQDAGPERRSAIAVDFMGATFASAHLLHTDDAHDSRQVQAQELAQWLSGEHPTVVAAAFGCPPGSPAYQAMLESAFSDVQAQSNIDKPTYLGPGLEGEFAEIRDFVFVRNAQATDFQLLPVPWSDHFPLVARVATGAQAPTQAEQDRNEVQPVPSTSTVPSIGASPSPEATTSPSPGASASPSPSPSPSPSN